MEKLTPGKQNKWLVTGLECFPLLGVLSEGMCDTPSGQKRQPALHAHGYSGKARSFTFVSVQPEQSPFQLRRGNPQVNKLTLDACVDIKWALPSQLNCLTKENGQKNSNFWEEKFFSLSLIF